MDLLIRPQPPISISLWRDTIAPKEHGSWSLAFEPIVLSLLVAPSPAGVGLAVALAAVFFSRRPWRIAGNERRVERWTAAIQALLGCAGIALAAFGGTVLIGGVAWMWWLVPIAVAGGVFVYFDTRGAGREQVAEVAGATAFALAPAAFASLAGWAPLEATALALIVTGRSVGSVLCVRAFLRATKTGVRCDLPALIVAAAAVTISGVLVKAGLVPVFAVIAMTAFAARSFVLLVAIRPPWRARTVGMMEAILGGLFILGLAITWNV